MNKDSHLIYETYSNTSANKEVLDEGLFDRLKARGSQAVGATKGLGQQALGKAQSLAGKAVGGVAGKLGGGQAATDFAANIEKSAQKKIGGGKIAGDIAKYKSYINSAVSGTINDLKKLNMPIADEAALKQALTDTIIGQLTQVTKAGQFRGPGGRIGGKVT